MINYISTQVVKNQYLVRNTNQQDNRSKILLYEKLRLRL
jgi:hypothetical protein